MKPLLSLFVSSVCFVGLLSGCSMLKGDGDVRAAMQSASELSALIPDSAVSDPKAKQALSAFRKLSGQDAPAPVAAPGELVSDGFADFAGNPLVGGVQRVKIYRDVQVIAPPVLQPVPAAVANPAQATSSPVPGHDLGGSRDNVLPPPDQVRNSSTAVPQGSAQAPATGGTSSIANPKSQIATVSTYRADLTVAKAEGSAASMFEGARAVVELSVNTAGASGGASLVSGRVLSISNCPLADGKDLSRLVFSDVAASVSEQGVVTVASEPGAEIQFEAALNGNSLTATVIPTAGSVAAAFFQHLEITGTAELLRTETATNYAPSVPSVVKSELLRSARWSPFPRVAFDAPEIEARADDGSAKRIIGQLFLNGRKVEWIAKGRQWSTVHNATVPGKYFQPMKSGDTVTISIADLGGRNESNRKELVVP